MVLSVVPANISNSNDEICEYWDGVILQCFKLRPSMVLSVVPAKMSIFSCFSILSEHVFLTWFAITLIIPTTIATDSIPIRAGAATIFGKSPTLVVPKPIAATPRIVSIELIILDRLLYFLPTSSFHLVSLQVQTIPYSFKSISLAWLGTALFLLFNLTYTTTLLRYKHHFQLVFELPNSQVLTKFPHSVQVRKFLLGTEPYTAYAGKNPASIFILWAKCIFDFFYC